MIYIAVLCNPKSPQNRSNTPLFIWPYAAAYNTALLAWRPSQGTKLYCLVNRGTLGGNNLPRVVARIVLRSESNPRPLDHESNALPLHHRVMTSECRRYLAVIKGSECQLNGLLDGDLIIDVNCVDVRWSYEVLGVRMLTCHLRPSITTCITTHN